MFPENQKERESYIEEAILRGDFDARWTTITRNIGGTQLELLVMEDALKVDGVRVNVSAAFAQRLADLFDASLPTAKVADMMFSSAARVVTPSPFPISSSVSAMLKHSQQVDKKLSFFPAATGLVATCGKHWVLDKKLEGTSRRACNYGWHFTGPDYQGIKGSAAVSPDLFNVPTRVIQPNATAHDHNHSDYSQVCQLVAQRCIVDGVELRFEDLVKDPARSHLVSHQGPLKIDRQPDTIRVTGRVVLLPEVISLESSSQS